MLLTLSYLEHCNGVNALYRYACASFPFEMEMESKAYSMTTQASKMKELSVLASDIISGR